MTAPKKGNQRIRVTTTMSNGSMSKAMMQLLHYQSLKVSNTNNSNNVQVCIKTVQMYVMKYLIILNK